jgi:hypothetical protein
MITAELGAAARMFEEPVFGSIIYIMRIMGRRAAWAAPTVWRNILRTTFVSTAGDAETMRTG